jgi:hypothetical protein
MLAIECPHRATGENGPKLATRAAAVPAFARWATARQPSLASPQNLNWVPSRSSLSERRLVREVGVATSNNFNAVVCPASVKATFARKGQFPELSSASQAQ